ncbi:glycerophosphodiester phosphodiesterase [Naumannella halotolerans]|uniref:Glycerophosphoryl diester phosphodiesterase n=1 Tax=Naumannella halotolerans TaxID=993414 RepID=A0A4R7J0N4_9ACTN|nr:glycerophosphodiester phosphodiesterase family protein [Naumannella halotolerans]TDT29857.1 glycerophosphoryl diester phosphodiesterase [Naumannella halotolerans]
MIVTGSGSTAPASSAIIAHRGASALAPENTLAAAELGIAHGAELIECDVQRTADGELVVIHDPTAGRTTNVSAVLPRLRPWNISELTLAQLQSLDAGSWFDVAYADQRVPTLTQWLETIGPRAGMQIEIKQTSEKYPVEHELADILTASPAAQHAIADGRLVIQAFDLDWLRGRYAPLAGEGVRLGALCNSRPSSKLIESLSSWADQLNPRLGATDRSLIDNAHRHGLQVCVWTVDKTADMRRLLDAGADGIITNEPAKLLALSRRNRLPTN